jgi:hypothetical protein
MLGVVALLEVGSVSTFASGPRKGGGENARPWSDMQVPNRADAVEAVLEGGKGRGLREEHQEAVEALVQMRVTFGFEELESQVYFWIISKLESETEGGVLHTSENR